MLPVRIQAVALGGKLCKVCIQSVLMLFTKRCIGRISMRIPGKRHILLSCQDILHTTDIHSPYGRAVLNRDGCCDACCLSGADTLRDQVQPVDGNIIRREMPSRAEQSLYVSVDAEISNHPFVDNTILRLELLRNIVDGVPNPFIIGRDAYKRYENMFYELCLRKMKES